MTKKKIGFYGGTFDPLHFGHINLALSLKETHHLDEIWFCPAWQSPHKNGDICTTPEQRLAMVKLGVDPIPNCKVLDLEVNRKGPSYTVETLKELHKLHPQNKFYLLMGNDTAKSFFQWKDPKTIIELAKPIVGIRTRINDFSLAPGTDMGVLTVLMEGITETPVIEISSTEIRKKILEKEYVGHLLPQKIIDYILENNLYL